MSVVLQQIINTNPRCDRGFRSHFWAKENNRCAIMWSVLILCAMWIAFDGWKGGRVPNQHERRSIREILHKRSGLYTADDTGVFLNCTIPSIHNFPSGLLGDSQREHGGVLLNLAVMFYMFAALAIICEDYFMPALQHICDDLNLKEDVAGATFMSVGGSAPELFASVIGVFIAKGDIGIGTIVGSAVFNLLFVVGLCGVLAGKEILLTCWPLVRDSTCYVITIGALVLAVSDGVIYWYDATMLLLLYIGYLTLMYFNEDIHRKVSNWMTHNVKCEYKKSYDLERTLAVRSAEGEMLLSRNVVEDDEEDELFRRKVNFNEKRDLLNGPAECNNNKLEDTKSSFTPPDSFVKLVPWLLSLPILVAFCITIPDCRKEKRGWCYPVTFVISLMWIGGLTFILVWMVTVTGYVFGINDTIMGLTLLAAGASTPDTILSVIAAREGYGDMAISHSIGSNLFDILVGLGCPWFLQTVVVSFNSSVSIYSGAITYISFLLLINVIVLVAAVTFARFKLSWRLGVLLLLLYFVFIVVSLLFELNLIIPDLTLPVCIH